MKDLINIPNQIKIQVSEVEIVIPNKTYIGASLSFLGTATIFLLVKKILK